MGGAVFLRALSAFSLPALPPPYLAGERMHVHVWGSGGRVGLSLVRGNHARPILPRRVRCDAAPQPCESCQLLELVYWWIQLRDIALANEDAPPLIRGVRNPSAIRRPHRVICHGPTSREVGESHWGRAAALGRAHPRDRITRSRDDLPLPVRHATVGSRPVGHVLVEGVRAP